MFSCKITVPKVAVAAAISFAALTTGMESASAADPNVQARLERLERLLGASGGEEDLLTRLDRLEKLLEKSQPLLEKSEKILELADKPVIKSGKKNVSVTINGQVNNKVRFASNGTDNDVRILDNNASSNRLRVLGDAKLNDRFSVKTAFELDFELESDSATGFDDSFLFGQNVGEGDEDTEIDLRRLEAIFIDKQLGDLTIGQGDTASNKSAEADLSGSFLAVGDATFDDDALAFATSNGGGVGLSLGTALDAQDGLSRQPRVRYRTPKFAGFGGEVAYIGDRTFDGSITYDQKSIGDFAVKGRAAYYQFLDDPGDTANGGNGETISQGFTGSLSVLHKPTGLNLTGGYFNLFEDADAPAILNADGSFDSADSPQAWWVKAGIQRQVIDAGKTAFAVDYQRQSGIESTGGLADGAAGVLVSNATSSQSIGVQLTQNIDALSTEAYIGYRWADADTGGLNVSTGAALDSSISDLHIINVGARVKF